MSWEQYSKGAYPSQRPLWWPNLKYNLCHPEQIKVAPKEELRRDERIWMGYKRGWMECVNEVHTKTKRARTTPQKMDAWVQTIRNTLWQRQQMFEEQNERQSVIMWHPSGGNPLAAPGMSTYSWAYTNALGQFNAMANSTADTDVAMPIDLTMPRDKVNNAVGMTTKTDVLPTVVDGTMAADEEMMNGMTTADDVTTSYFMTTTDGIKSVANVTMMEGMTSVDGKTMTDGMTSLDDMTTANDVMTMVVDMTPVDDAAKRYYMTKTGDIESEANGTMMDDMTTANDVITENFMTMVADMTPVDDATSRFYLTTTDGMKLVVNVTIMDDKTTVDGKMMTDGMTSLNDMTTTNEYTAPNIMSMVADMTPVDDATTRYYMTTTDGMKIMVSVAMMDDMTKVDGKTMTDDMTMMTDTTKTDDVMMAVDMTKTASGIADSTMAAELTAETPADKITDKTVDKAVDKAADKTDYPTADMTMVVKNVTNKCFRLPEYSHADNDLVNTPRTSQGTTSPNCPKTWYRGRTVPIYSDDSDSN